MSAHILITCNDCATTGPDPRKTHRESRRYLRTLGWTNRRAGVDYCAACSTKRKSDAAPGVGYV